MTATIAINPAPRIPRQRTGVAAALALGLATLMLIVTAGLQGATTSSVRPGGHPTPTPSSRVTPAAPPVLRHAPVVLPSPRPESVP